MTQPRRKPAPRQRQRVPDWETMPYEHIKKRWREQDAKVKQAEHVLRWWKAATAAAWLFVLILLLVLTT